MGYCWYPPNEAPIKPKRRINTSWKLNLLQYKQVCRACLHLVDSNWTEDKLDKENNNSGLKMRVFRVYLQANRLYPVTGQSDKIRGNPHIPAFIKSLPLSLALTVDCVPFLFSHRE